jgi:hypothetical protein
MVIRKEKEAKRKENRPDGKVENAMKLRFQLSHRTRYQRRREKETTGAESTRRRSIDRIIVRRATCASIIQPGRGGIFR